VWRRDLAIRALANSASVTDLSAEHGVSRKLVYEQKSKASAALDETFAIDASHADEEVLFELKVTRRWLRQVILALTLICRSSFRGVIEFLLDLVRLRWACMTRSSKAASQCSPMSMRRRRTAMCLKPSSIVTLTRGVFACRA
jgi:hypothetical protein